MLAVVQAARSLPSLEVEAVHLGTQAEVERRILDAARIPARQLSVGGLRGMNPVRLTQNAARMAAAVRPALRTIDETQPDVTFTSGGYVSAPAVLASRLRKVPVLLFSADVSAGLAIRTEARLAARIALPVPEAAVGLPGGRTFVSGYPVRPELHSLPPRDEAKRTLGFNPDRPLVLVFGGSQGARALNQAISAGLDRLLPVTQVMHIAGALDAPSLASRPGYRVETFVQEMPLALAAADLAICRAGASTLGELPAAGLPALLVPGPFAGGHQRHNAAVLERARGAEVVANELVAAELVDGALALLASPERLAAMSAAMRAQFRPEAARLIAEELVRLAA
ncbi:MAG: glycosyltransferase [Chloroflexi bacterium]|nr:glycosyltransferase [Chloroflexota bacterium]